MADKEQLPREPSEKVREKQLEGYSDTDYLSDLERVTKKLDQAASEPDRGSPRRSGRSRRDG